ncbi:MAG: ABC transporter substrate-binding protein [Spirochaetes bacterium]|nr:ABC transporter substrate-binding protein [Spirochaetota bacterium]
MHARSAAHRLAVFPLAAILLAAASVTVSARSAKPEQPARLRILVPQSASSIPFLMLADEDPVKGIDIQVETFLVHAQALALLLRGDADLLYTGTSQGWENRLGGSPIVIVGTGVWGVSSLVGRDASIARVADLKGRRIALPFPGSPLDFQMRYLLERAGLDPDRDLEISYGAFTQSLPRLLAGQLDAVAMPEPQATTAVREKGLARLFRFADAWAAANGGEPRSPQVSLFAVAEWADSHARTLASLVTAWRQASTKTAAKPADTAARYAGSLSVDAALLGEALGNTILWVPGFSDHKARVLAYYREVVKYLPGERKPLDDAFFFAP